MRPSRPSLLRIAYRAPRILASCARLRRIRVPLLGACALLALAAAGAAAAAEGDPPTVAARLSYAAGAVSMQPAGVQQWTDAVVNRPFTTGDRLWTDQGSRAELQLGSIAIRLAESTGFSFLDLGDTTAQMQVTAGTLEIHVPELGPNQSIEIDTPALAVVVQQTGDYRVDVDDTGDSARVEVISGEVEVSAAGQTIPLHTQQQGTFNGAGGLTADIGTLGTPDDFDSWCFERDRREAQARQDIGSYVSPAMTGYEDLNEYGTWRDEPQFGYVWVPTAIPVGWAPYRIGRWVWVEPWGWTWVDAQPWGFAPFHYGRWAYLRGAWCWVPGSPRARPVYAPALVAWVGGGPGVSLSLSVGPGVAWFPLGPRDVYVPPYRVSNTYIRNVNITNTTVISNTYITNVIQSNGRNYRSVNQSIPGAVTAVPRTVFTSAQPVAPHAIRLTPTSLRRERVSATPPPIAPVRASVLGTGAAPGRRVPAPPSRLVDRPVVAVKIPPPAPLPFEKARQAIIANGGRPVPPPQLARLRPNPAPRAFRSAREAPPGRRAEPGGPAQQAGPGGSARFRVPGRPGSFAPPGQPPGRELRVPPGPRTEGAPGREFRTPPAPGAPERPRVEPRPFQQPERPPVERQPFRPPPRPPAESQPFRPPQRPQVEPRPSRPPERPRVERQPFQPPERPRIERAPPPRAAPAPRLAPAPHGPPPPGAAGPRSAPPPHGVPQRRGEPEERP